MKSKIKIDGTFVENAFEEIKKKLRDILDSIDARAASPETRVPDSAATDSPDAQSVVAGGDVRADGGSVQELEEARLRIQDLSAQNKEFVSKLEAVSGSAAQQEEDGEIERLKGQDAEQRQQLEAAQRTQQEKDGEIERLKGQDAEQRQQLEAAQRAQQEKDREIENLKRKNVEERQQLQEAAQRAQQEKDGEIERLKRKNVEERQQLQEAAQRAQQEKDGEIENLKRKNVEERQQLQEAAQRAQQEKDGEIERLKGENDELSKQVTAVASNDRIEDVIWPTFMAEQSTVEYKERLKGELHADAPSPLAIRLVADLFSYNANHKLKSDKKAPLLSSVHRLGESLFAWLSESDSDQDQVYEKGQAWADLLNKESNDAFKIEVPMIDCEFDRKTMVNYGSGSSSADVGRIHSWCVKDAEGRTQHLAEVTLT